MSPTISGSFGAGDLDPFQGLEWDAGSPRFQCILDDMIDYLLKEDRTAERVADLWRKVAAEKDPKAMVKLGKIYLFGGDGVTRDCASAFKLLNDAADLNDSEAMIALPWVLRAAKGSSDSVDNPYRYFMFPVTDKTNKVAEAIIVEKVRKAAENGNPGAIYSLGVMQSHGLFMPLDDEQASKSVAKAAELKNPQAMAQYGLGLCYTGRIEEGVKLCKQAIDAGYKCYTRIAFALERLGDKANAIMWLRKGADASDVASMKRLALSWYKGGVSDDEAIDLYERCVEQGDVSPSILLGDIHKDARRGRLARYWYEKFFEECGLRNGRVMFMIGELYKNGLNDLAPDQQKAEEWFRKGAEWGDPEAMIALGDMAREAGKGEEAVRWYKKALKEDVAFCLGEDKAEVMLSIGELYENGLDDLPADQKEAVKWYREADAKWSNREAAEKLRMKYYAR